MSHDQEEEEDDIPTIGAAMVEPIDFEKGMNLFPAVTIAIGVFCIFAFMMEVSQKALENEDSIIAVGALNGKKVADGEYWRLLSAVFLHGSFDHLLGNLIVLYILGMGCEHALGKAQTLTLFVFSGLCGSLGSLVNGVTSLGASGAIFGLAGGLVGFFVRHRHRYDVRDHRIGWLILAWAAYQIYLGMHHVGTDNGAHIGGCIGGSLIALAMKPAVGTEKGGDFSRPFVAIGLIISLLLLLGTAIFFLPRLVK